VPTILVVDDEPIVRNLIVHVLSRQGFVVFEADSATEALIVCRALKDEPLDLLITDHALQGTTGRALANRISESCPNVKVLQLSTGAHSALKMQDALLPGSSFLQKPFTPGQLVNAVQNVLNQRTQ
jgi:CheY-like chemotaxis protein